MVKTHPQGDYRYQDPKNEAEVVRSHADGRDHAGRGTPRMERS